MNDNGHPVGADAVRLAELEEKIEDFPEQKHTVHFLGRVIRRGSQDLLYFVDKPRFEESEVNSLSENIMKERAINFSLAQDPYWKAVSGFIK